MCLPLDALVQYSLVNMLALHGRSTALGLPGVLDDTLVSQLGPLGLQSPLGLLLVAVVELAVHYAANVVPVLLGEDLAVLDRLNLAVVVVLVHLLVDGGVDLLVPGRLDGLVLHCRSNLLVDSGVMVAGLGHKVLNCLLGRVHYGVVGCLELWWFKGG